ncbi:MAG: flavodoxin domain-containing protein [Bacteroidales bacterium]
MKDYLILYWNKGGNVEKAAKLILQNLGKENTDICDLQSFPIHEINNYKLIIAGGATVGAQNWEEAKADNQWNLFFNQLKDKHISLSKVALFGLGDQLLYPNNFVDHLSNLYEGFSALNAKLIGKWPIETYTFTESTAIENKHFLGLALDNDRQAHLSPERIAQWVKQLKKEI